MSIIQAIILGLVQGLTEFIPVSSSGHLILMHEILGITDDGLAFDVALHIGTLVALLALFWWDIWRLAKSLFIKSDQTRVAKLLIMATVPAILAGLFLDAYAETTFRSPLLVSLNLIIVALIMLAAERYGARTEPKTSLQHIETTQAIFMGIVQAAAIVPGISRSGSTITAGIFAGLDRVAASRFSFLLAIPITFGAILKVFAQPGTATQISNDMMPFLVGIVTAFGSGFLAMRFLLKYLAKHSLHVFAYYRIALGLVALIILLFVQR